MKDFEGFLRILEDSLGVCRDSWGFLLVFIRIFGDLEGFGRIVEDLRGFFGIPFLARMLKRCYAGFLLNQRDEST